jgi:hypothetical protein
MKKQWSTTSKYGITYFVKVDDSFLQQVVFWEEGRYGDPRDMGGNISFDKFMKGACRKLIKEQHGEETLKEVVALVKKIRKENRKKK